MKKYWGLSVVAVVCGVVVGTAVLLISGQMGQNVQTDEQSSNRDAPIRTRRKEMTDPPAAVDDHRRQAESPATNARELSRAECLDRLLRAVRAAPGNVPGEDVRREISAFRDAGYEPADGLIDLYSNHAAPAGGDSVKIGMIIIAALIEMQDPESCRALKKIAKHPGAAGSVLGPRTVKAIAVSCNDVDEISELLESESPGIRDEAAMALQGRALTDATVKRLGEMLHSNSWVTHNLVATAFATDRSTATSILKRNILLSAIPQLEVLKDVPQAELPIPSTARALALNAYISALAAMPGADDLLREKLVAANAESVEYKVLVLASALRKDKSTYPEIVKLARNDESGLIRSLATRGLGFIGSRQDIELLEIIASTDPYKVQQKGRDPGNLIYPVRIQAKQAIQELRKENDPG